MRAAAIVPSGAAIDDQRRPPRIARRRDVRAQAPNEKPTIADRQRAQIVARRDPVAHRAQIVHHQRRVVASRPAPVRPCPGRSTSSAAIPPRHDVRRERRHAPAVAAPAVDEHRPSPPCVPPGARSHAFDRERVRRGSRRPRRRAASAGRQRPGARRRRVQPSPHERIEQTIEHPADRRGRLARPSTRGRARVLPGPVDSARNARCFASDAGIAQLVERLIRNQQVPSSSLGAGSICAGINDLQRQRGKPVKALGTP